MVSQKIPKIPFNTLRFGNFVNGPRCGTDHLRRRSEKGDKVRMDIAATGVYGRLEMFHQINSAAGEKCSRMRFKSNYFEVLPIGVRWLITRASDLQSKGCEFDSRS